MTNPKMAACPKAKAAFLSFGSFVRKPIANRISGTITGNIIPSGIAGKRRVRRIGLWVKIK